MNNLEEKYWRKVEKYLPVLQMVPFVKMIAVCNNLAFGKIDETSDIDLFVVAKSGRLFIVRTFVTFLLHVLGVRRHGNKIAGRFCLSFFVDEEAVDLSGIALERDIYLAFWVRSLVPVIDDGFSAQFLEKNWWILDYFEVDENLVLRNDRVFKSGSFKCFLNRIFGFVLRGRFGDFIEKKLEKWQLKRAGEKALLASEESSLLIGEHILKFHNVDRRRKYRGLWQDRFGESKISAEKFKEIVL